jgi:hypothetical protein
MKLTDEGSIMECDHVRFVPQSLITSKSHAQSQHTFLYLLLKKKCQYDVIRTFSSGLPVLTEDHIADEVADLFLSLIPFQGVKNLCI